MLWQHGKAEVCVLCATLCVVSYLMILALYVVFDLRSWCGLRVTTNGLPVFENRSSVTAFRLSYWRCMEGSNHSNRARGNRNSDPTATAGAGSSVCGVFRKA
jgi:hypothetical protein